MSSLQYRKDFVMSFYKNFILNIFLFILTILMVLLNMRIEIIYPLSLSFTNFIFRLIILLVFSFCQILYINRTTSNKFVTYYLLGLLFLEIIYIKDSTRADINFIMHYDGIICIFISIILLFLLSLNFKKILNYNKN